MPDPSASICSVSDPIIVMVTVRKVQVSFCKSDCGTFVREE